MLFVQSVKVPVTSSEQQGHPISLFITRSGLLQGLYDMLVYFVEEAGFEPAPMPSCASMYLCFLLHHSPRLGAAQPNLTHLTAGFLLLSVFRPILSVRQIVAVVLHLRKWVVRLWLVFGLVDRFRILCCQLCHVVDTIS